MNFHAEGVLFLNIIPYLCFIIFFNIYSNQNLILNIFEYLNFKHFKVTCFIHNITDVLYTML